VERQGWRRLADDAPAVTPDPALPTEPEST